MENTQRKEIQNLLKIMVIVGVLQLLLIVMAMGVQIRVNRSYDQTIATNSKTTQALNNLMMEAYQYENIYLRYVTKTNTYEDYAAELLEMEGTMKAELQSIDELSIPQDAEGLKIKVENAISVLCDMRMADIDQSSYAKLSEQCRIIVSNTSYMRTYVEQAQSEAARIIQVKIVISEVLCILVIALTVALTAYLIVLSVQHSNRIAATSDIASCKDELTRLWNRKYIEKYLPGIISKSDTGFLFMCDMDNFKKVNDTLGHGKGDEVLQRFAKILQQVLREDDPVCRLGGDEFMFYTAGVEDAKTAKRIANSIRNKMASEFSGTEFEIVTLSCGAAKKTDGEAFQDFYKRADSALYEVKESGKNGFIVYSK